MSLIRKKVSDEEMTGWCHNKSCELYPHGFQGAAGLEGELFKCCVCEELLHDTEPKGDL